MYPEDEKLCLWNHHGLL